MTDMVYNIGSPELVNQYDFVQSPLCQYSFTKSPQTPTGPIKHVRADKEWIVYEAFDFSLMGVYPFTLRYEIEQFTDYTKTATEIIFNEYDFTVYIEPCVVTDYVATLQVTEIRYALNTPPLTDGSYVFD